MVESHEVALRRYAQVERPRLVIVQRWQSFCLPVARLLGSAAPLDDSSSPRRPAHAV